MAGFFDKYFTFKYIFFEVMPFILFSLLPLCMSGYSYFQIKKIREGYKKKIKLPTIEKKIHSLKEDMYDLLVKVGNKSLIGIELGHFNTHISDVISIIDQSEDYLSISILEKKKGVATVTNKDEAWVVYQEISSIYIHLEGMNEDLIL